VNFTWDERKNRVNKRKHGISFEIAILVFDDPYHLSLQDREVDGELRWQTIGMVNGNYALLIAHTVDVVNEDQIVIRVISGRKSNSTGKGHLCERQLKL
jgi:uncharacterized DUF497 family protein